MMHCCYSYTSDCIWCGRLRNLIKVWVVMRSLSYGSCALIKWNINLEQNLQTNPILLGRAFKRIRCFVKSSPSCAHQKHALVVEINNSTLKASQMWRVSHIRFTFIVLCFPQLVAYCYTAIVFQLDRAQ